MVKVRQGVQGPCVTLIISRCSLDKAQERVRTDTSYCCAHGRKGRSCESREGVALTEAEANLSGLDITICG
jgi:hypothetical protein